MSFARSPVRRSSTDTVVHAVGQRVYVSRTGSAANAHVDLMNDEGTTVIAALPDGTEVMIVAWKPRGATGTRYCVRCTSNDLEGWLAAANLRRGRTVAPTPVTPAPLPKSAPAQVSTSPQLATASRAPANVKGSAPANVKGSAPANVKVSAPANVKGPVAAKPLASRRRP